MERKLEIIDLSTKTIKLCGKRETGSNIKNIIILNTGCTDIGVEHVIEAFKSKNCSVNYFIDLEGKIYRIIPEEKRAWSTANSYMDSRSITIMVENSVCSLDTLFKSIKVDTTRINIATEISLKQLCRNIMDKYNISELKFNSNLGNFRYFVPMMNANAKRLSVSDKDPELYIKTVYENYPNHWIPINMERIAKEINSNIF